MKIKVGKANFIVKLFLIIPHLLFLFPKVCPESFSYGLRRVKALLPITTITKFEDKNLEFAIAELLKNPSLQSILTLLYQQGSYDRIIFCEDPRESAFPNTSIFTKEKEGSGKIYIGVIAIPSNFYDTYINDEERIAIIEHELWHFRYNAVPEHDQMLNAYRRIVEEIDRAPNLDPVQKAALFCTLNSVWDAFLQKFMVESGYIQNANRLVDTNLNLSTRIIKEWIERGISIPDIGNVASVIEALFRGVIPFAENGEDEIVLANKQRTKGVFVPLLGIKRYKEIEKNYVPPLEKIFLEGRLPTYEELKAIFL